MLHALVHVERGRGAWPFRLLCRDSVAQPKKPKSRTPNEQMALANAQSLRRAGDAAGAYSACKVLLAHVPKSSRALGMLGAIELERGRFAEAIEWLQRACAVDATSSAYRANLGIAFYRGGNASQAVEHLLRACELNPTNAIAALNLGLAYLDSNDVERGLRALVAACKARPGDWGIQLSLAKELVKVGQVEPALVIFRAALRAERLPLEHCVDFMMVLQSCDQFTALLEVAEGLLGKQPNLAKAHAVLGSALARKSRYDEAVVEFGKSTELEPKLSWWVTPQLASALSNRGQVNDAIDLLRPLTSEPSQRANHSELLLLMNFSERYSALEHDAEARRFDELHTKALQAEWRPHTHSKDPQRRLKIGYVSHHFRDHVLSLFLLPLFKHHDRTQVQVYAYSGVRYPDAYTAEFERAVDVWRDVSRLEESAVAQLVRDDQIDVLIDLSMHVAAARIGVFARKPAPVQLCWLAYPGTTGLIAMDYRVSDHHLDPTNCAAPSVERVLRLPDSIWCYDPDVEFPNVNSLPALDTGVVTFGCLNVFAKLNPAVFRLWAQVLEAVPRSRLVLHAPAGWARDFARDVLRSHGIADERYEFVGRQARGDYLATYHRIDIVLDSFPYGGHTTALESFVMGVPVVVMPGDTPVSRGGVSIAANLDLREFVAETPSDYVNIAVKWANDPTALSQLRQSLRNRVRQSPLMQPARFSRAFEHALRTAWHNHCIAP